jgi:hypothetical protein
VHAIGAILILGYSMEYYFHLRKWMAFSLMEESLITLVQATTRTTLTKRFFCQPMGGGWMYIPCPLT